MGATTFNEPERGGGDTEIGNPPARPETRNEDLHPTILDWPSHSIYKATEIKETCRNFEVFKIPMDKYYMLDNIGAGHCIWYVWAQFLHCMSVAPIFQDLSEENQVANMLFLRKLVFRDGNNKELKMKMTNQDECLGYMLQSDVNQEMDPEIRQFLVGEQWEENLNEVYDPDLPTEEWTPTKFDVVNTEAHRRLQPNPLFVAAFLMEHFKKFQFRLITFRIYHRVWRGQDDSAVAGLFLKPDSTQISMADARSGESVVYRKSEMTLTNYFKPEWDDGRTFFMFVDGVHVNAMFRLPPGTEMPLPLPAPPSIGKKRKRRSNATKKKKARSKRG